MNFGLTTEQQMVVDTVRGFVEKELYPHERGGRAYRRVQPELGEAIKSKVIDLGFYAPNLPVEVGGGGLDNLTLLCSSASSAARRWRSACSGAAVGILQGCRG